MLPFRVWEFLLGAVAAWHIPNKNNESQNLWTSLVLLAVLVAVIIIYPLDQNSLSIWLGHQGMATIFVSLCTAIILAKPLEKTFSNQNIIGRLFCKIGDYSYSIYLVHFPIIILVNYEHFQGTKLGIYGLKNTVIILTLTFIAAYFMFNYVEIIRTKKNFKKSFLVLSLISLLAILISPVINKHKFTNEQNLIFEAWADRDIYRCGKVFRILNPTESVCKIDSIEGSKKVFLVGDSHADSLKASFSKHMVSKEISTYFYVANNPLTSSRTNATALVSDVIRLEISDVVIHFSSSSYQEQNFLSELKIFLSALRAANIDIYFISPVTNIQIPCTPGFIPEDSRR